MGTIGINALAVAAMVAGIRLILILVDDIVDLLKNPYKATVQKRDLMKKLLLELFGGLGLLVTGFFILFQVVGGIMTIGPNV